MSKDVFFNSPSADRQIMRVLRFMREYLHITTKEISEAMEGDYHSRSLIASIENRFRNPDANFIVEYAKVIQEKSRIKSNLLYIAQKCIEDKSFIKLMDEYYNNDFDFRTIYKISSKINQLNSSLSSSTNREDPTKLPGNEEINWDEFLVDAKPDDEPVVIPFEQDTDTSFDMFKLSEEEFDAL